MNETLFNTIVNQVVYSLDNFLKDNYYPSELMDYLYLIVVGMNITYKDKFVSDVYDVIKDTKIIMKPVIREDMSLDYYKDPSNNNYLYKEVYSSGFLDVKFKYGMLFRIIDNSPIKTLEYMIYNYNYLLFHKDDKYSLKDNVKIKIDTIINGGITVGKYNNDINVIDKVINLLQSEDIIRNLKQLSKVKINNKKFRKALNILNGVDFMSYKIDGLDIITTLFRPLYQEEKIKKIINSKKGSARLAKEFNAIIGKNAYKYLSKDLDILDKLIENVDDNKNILYYDISVKYIYLKNHYINRFMNEILAY